MLLLSAGFCPASFQKDTSDFNGSFGFPLSGLSRGEVSGKPLMAVSDGTVGDALKGAYAEYKIGDYLYGNVGDWEGQAFHNNRAGGKLFGDLLPAGAIVKATATLAKGAKVATLARLTKAPPKVKGSGVVQTVGRFGGELPDTGKLVQLDEYLEHGVVAAKATAVADGKFYSTAFETTLAPTSYPGVSRYMHFKEANAALDAAMQSNPALSKLGISVPRSSNGSILGKSPENWVWHHDTGAGVMQLVPKTQHPNIPGGIFWETMHPGGNGGFSIWGK